MAFSDLWQNFLLPLARLLAGMSCGLLLASFLESLQWTDRLAKISLPLIRRAHMGPIAASAFSLAFFSPPGANGLLSEAYSQKRITGRELLLANLFNGLPAFFTHAPTIFLLTWPAIGWAAAWYTAISLGAAIFRAIITISLGRILLKKPIQNQPMGQSAKSRQPFFTKIRAAPAIALGRFRKRLPKLILYTAPVYGLMFLAQECGFFQSAQEWLGAHLAWLGSLRPQAMGIIAMQLVAEMGAALGAASAALADGSLSQKDIVLAMLVGNVLATPLRAIRHQFPAYAGFYTPAVALRLVAANQGLRAFSMILCILAWIIFCG